MENSSDKLTRPKVCAKCGKVGHLYSDCDKQPKSFANGVSRAFQEICNRLDGWPRQTKRTLKNMTPFREDLSIGSIEPLHGNGVGVEYRVVGHRGQVLSITTIKSAQSMYGGNIAGIDHGNRIITLKEPK